MKNLFKYLFILLIISCDLSKIFPENSQPLSPEAYMAQGWSYIQDSYEYQNAINTFQNLINDNKEDQNILVQASHGLSWAQILYGIYDADYNNRLDAMKKSYDDFFITDSILTEMLELDPPFENTAQYQCDIKAGKALYSDYRIYYYNNQYFATGAGANQSFLDTLSWFSAGEELAANDPACLQSPIWPDCNSNGHIDLGLTSLVEALEGQCPEYDFQYNNESVDYNINLYHFQLMLLKDYIRKSEFDEAKLLIERINRSEIPILFNLDLNGQSPSSSISIIGDFKNKSINEFDLKEMFLNPDNTYSIQLNLYPYLPCNLTFEENQMSNQMEGEDLRDELLECVNSYFESNESQTFRYKFVNGDYDENGNNQESVPGQCSDDEGYRILNIPGDSSSSNDCYNGCCNN